MSNTNSLNLSVVLVNPEIPQNTGSIARSCAATNSPLHLVGKLGFDISEKAVRRAGLDYWPYVELYEHADWDSYLKFCGNIKIWCFSKFATTELWEAEFSPGDALVFGSETKGLGSDFLSRYPDSQLRIPMYSENVRSLNLSNAVNIALYEGLRQIKFN